MVSTAVECSEALQLLWQRMLPLLSEYRWTAIGELEASLLWKAIFASKYGPLEPWLALFCHRWPNVCKIDWNEYAMRRIPTVGSTEVIHSLCDIVLLANSFPGSALGPLDGPLVDLCRDESAGIPPNHFPACSPIVPTVLLQSCPPSTAVLPRWSCGGMRCFASAPFLSHPTTRYWTFAPNGVEVGKGTRRARGGHERRRGNLETQQRTEMQIGVGINIPLNV